MRGIVEDGLHEDMVIVRRGRVEPGINVLVRCNVDINSFQSLMLAVQEVGVALLEYPVVLRLFSVLQL